MANEHLSQIWWASISIISIGNIFALLTILSKNPVNKSTYTKSMRILAGFYVVGCAFRSFLPRVDAERLCFYDSPLSAITIGRTVATIAELAFFAQLSLVFHQLSHEFVLHRGRAARDVFIQIVESMAGLTFVGIMIAELASWAGVLTTNHLWHCVEESLWMYCVMALTICAAILIWKWKQVDLDQEKQNPTKPWMLLYSFLICGPVYCLYMYLVDVPMYYQRWLQGQAQNVQYLSLAQGWASASRCHLVSQDFDLWLPDMIWMGAYFSVCVWGSLWLMRAPSFLPSLPTPKTESVSSSSSSKSKLKRR
jgi:hypothetical protein